MRDSRKIQLSRLSECETLAKSSFPDAQNACLFRNPLSGRLRNGGDPSRSKKVAQTELPESLSIRVRAHVFFSRNFRIQFDSRFDSRFDSFQTRKMRDSLKIQLSRRPKRETLAKSSFSDAQNARLFQNLTFQTFNCVLEHIEWVAGGWSLTFVLVKENHIGTVPTQTCLLLFFSSSLLLFFSSSSLVPMNSLLSTQDSYRFGGPIFGSIFGSIFSPIFSPIFG